MSDKPVTFVVAENVVSSFGDFVGVLVNGVEAFGHPHTILVGMSDNDNEKSVQEAHRLCAELNKVMDRFWRGEFES